LTGVEATDESKIPCEKVGKTAEDVQAVDDAKLEDGTEGSGAEMRVCETVIPGKKEETPPGGEGPVIAESVTIWQSGGSLCCVGGANGPIIGWGAGVGV
jgi:hypothetical protein